MRIISKVRRAYGLKTRYEMLREAGLLTKKEIAARLGVSASSPKQEARGGLLRESLNQLLRSPHGRRVVGHVDVQYAPPFMCQHNQDIQHTKSRGRDSEEGQRRRDRFFWVILWQLWKSWWEVLIIVKPETVIKWHRQGFKLYWRWKSNAPVGRLKIDKKLLKNTDESSIGEAHARE